MANSFVQIKLNGTELPPVTMGLLDSIVIENAMNLPDAVTASFVDPEGALVTRFWKDFGGSIEVSVSHDRSSTPETIMKGDITAVEIDYDAGHSGSGSRTIIRGLDTSHRLHAGRKTRAWRQATASEVASDVAKQAGLQLGAIDATTTTYQFVTQSNQSDMEFVQQLASDNNRHVVVEDGKFHFRKRVDTSAAPGLATPATPPPDPLQLVLHSGDLLSLHATVRGTGQVQRVEVRGWDPTNKQVVASEVTTATDSVSNGSGITPQTLTGKLTGAGQSRMVSTTRPFGTTSETQAAAEDLADQIASGFAEIDGTIIGQPRLKAGVAVSLSNAGPLFNGKYVVTATTHRIDDRGYETSFAVTGQHDRSLLGLVAGGVTGGAPERIAGVVPAVVVDNNDPEGQARVKVKFPWLDERYASEWVRMTQFGAGNNRGAVFLPEVDDEVLVAFEQGDMRRPYVIGSLYNGRDLPNTGNDLVTSAGRVKRHGYVSNKGSMLVFFDDDSDEGVAILTGDKGMKLALDKSNRVIHISSTGEIRIEAQDSITIESKRDLVLKGSKVSIEGQTEVSVQSMSVKVAGQQISLG